MKSLNRTLPEFTFLSRLCILLTCKFHLPTVGTAGKPNVYLCGNSLGLQPKKTRKYIMQELDFWQRRINLIHSGKFYKKLWSLPLGLLV